VTKKLTYVSVLLPMLIGCTPTVYEGQFVAGTCVAERNKRYIASAKVATKVYKVHDAYVDRFTVSVWNNKNWFYKGIKNHRYFNDNKTFAYEIVGCPDGSSKGVGITGRLKKIDI